MRAEDTRIPLILGDRVVSIPGHLVTQRPARGMVLQTWWVHESAARVVRAQRNFHIPAYPYPVPIGARPPTVLMPGWATAGGILPGQGLQARRPRTDDRGPRTDSLGAAGTGHGRGKGKGKIEDPGKGKGKGRGKGKGKDSGGKGKREDSRGKGKRGKGAVDDPGRDSVVRAGLDAQLDRYYNRPRAT